jgi:DNA-binding XRE family transcriptional regulator
MTKDADQYRAALAHLGLSQAAAAKWLGISRKTSSRYANGAPIPKAIKKLLRLMVTHKLKPGDVK